MSAEPETTVATVEAQHQQGFAHLLFAVGILATCSLITAMDSADPDLWGHVQYGREILRDGTLPQTATWTFTSIGTRWINHENLAELAMAGAVHLCGAWGLTLGKYLLGWILLGTIWWRARACGVSRPVAAFVCLTTAFTIEFHWHFRPQIFGYVYFGLMAALLIWCLPAEQEDQRTSGRLKYLFWLLPLFAIWTNTHGSFAAGVAVAVAFLGLRFLQTAFALTEKQTTAPLPPAAARRKLVILPLVAIGLSLATLLTPYGFELHQWLWKALHEPRPEIGDWESPSLFSFSREVIGFWVMTTTLVCTQFTRNRNSVTGEVKRPAGDWAAIIVFTLVALQAISHIRHLPLLAILWASWFATDLDRWWKQLVTDLRRQQSSFAAPTPFPMREDRPVGRSVLLNVALVVWIGTIGMATWPRLARLQVPRDKYPVDALKYMADNRLEGNTVVTFNWAQYAIGFFANENLNSTVGIDGRFRTCYPQEVIDIYFDFIFGDKYEGPRHRSSRSGPIDPERALTFKNPDLFLISRQQQPTVRTMEANQQEWMLLYQDALAQIWGKRERYQSWNVVNVDERVTPDAKLQSAMWPAFASELQHMDAAPRLTAHP